MKRLREEEDPRQPQDLIQQVFDGLTDYWGHFRVLEHDKKQLLDVIVCKISFDYSSL